MHNSILIACFSHIFQVISHKSFHLERFSKRFSNFAPQSLSLLPPFLIFIFKPTCSTATSVLRAIYPSWVSRQRHIFCLTTYFLLYYSFFLSLCSVVNLFICSFVYSGDSYNYIRAKHHKQNMKTHRCIVNHTFLWPTNQLLIMFSHQPVTSSPIQSIQPI